MPRSVLTLVLTLSNLVLASSGWADEKPAGDAKTIEAVPVVVTGAERFDLTSRAGDTFRVFVYRPAVEAPADGFPALYALDGNSTFLTLAELARRSERRGGGVVVVGIGYPIEGPMDVARRYYDLTPVPPAGVVSRDPGGRPVERVGGQDAFTTFLLEELRPAVEGRYPIDRTRQTLTGHSLGGLYTLHMLYTHPTAFRHYVAASPSVWWNDGGILAEEERFRKAWKAGPTSLLIVHGENEGRPRPGEPAERSAARRSNAGTGNVAAVADRLKSLRDRGLSVEYEVLTGEDHGSVIAPALTRAVRVAQQPAE